jgi:predicted TIM-barrel fold metal-dependent hydrolase
MSTGTTHVPAQRQAQIGMLREGGHRSPTVTFIPEPETEPLFCPMISVDDHALEPFGLFETRVPSDMQERAPRVVRSDDGTPWWHIDDLRFPIHMANGAIGRVMEEWGSFASDYDEFREGAWNSAVRVKDLDQGGIWASLCFGSLVWGFAGYRFSQMREPEVGLASLRAWNDWMIDEWCGAAPERFIPCQLPWLRDPEVGAEEIRRNASRGFKAVSFSEAPSGVGFDDIYQPSWDPFFRACEETDTVINLHVGSSGTRHQPSPSSGDAVAVALFPVSGIFTLIDWIFAHIPVKYPRIKIALSEAGVSWVPMAIERLSRAHRQSGAVGRSWPADAPTPMELVQRNFFFTSIEDPSGMQMLDIIGDDNVMVECDYPHFDSTWPAAQAMIRSMCSSLPPERVRKVCFENAARVYRHTRPPAWMIESSEVGGE